jgi:hypothetical protein
MSSTGWRAIQASSTPCAAALAISSAHRCGDTLPPEPCCCCCCWTSPCGPYTARGPAPGPAEMGPGQQTVTPTCLRRRGAGRGGRRRVGRLRLQRCPALPGGGGAKAPPGPCHPALPLSRCPPPHPGGRSGPAAPGRQVGAGWQHRWRGWRRVRWGGAAGLGPTCRPPQWPAWQSSPAAPSWCRCRWPGRGRAPWPPRWPPPPAAPCPAAACTAEPLASA